MAARSRRQVLSLGAAALVALALVSPASAAEARFDWFEYRGHDPAGVTPLKPGEYRNPILRGFYPDPSLTRVGDDFYLVTSTFAYFPGLPVFHSRDLVNWTQIGNAIDRPDQLDFKDLGLSRGVFAPTISHRDGTFYILNTCVDCGGNYLITAKDPSGPWSDPIWIKDVDGIDPSFFFDEDGRTWLLNNGPPEGAPLYPGHRAIWIQEFDLAARKPIGPRKVLVNGGVDLSTKPIWIEGPHIFKRGGWYYLSCAEGGTAEGHSQVILRSRNVLGPYEPWSGNPILTQRGLPRGRPHPITSAGHAQLVQTAKGEWWASFLATQPYAGDFYNTGRETFLLPVKWTDDGWPVILPSGQAIPRTHRRPDLPPAPAGTPPEREEFDGKALGPEWMTIRNPRGPWYRLDAGTLVLEGAEPLGGSGHPAYAGRRQQHVNAEAATRVRFTPARGGDRAGLVALQSPDFFYALTVGREGGAMVVALERRAGPKAPVNGEVVATAPVPAGQPVELKITARGGRYDFAYALAPGRWTTLAADQDGTILSTKTAGGFVGATFGLYAYSPARPDGD
ncbi:MULTISPECIES: glycoside hydrolase family 43 protein [unclassified Phenylobacterium]|uniref:glycoside hydrolase family 43 protein n=1 Tax=unclassified Phenylobacterium TaxID=2640670 RepID=UPI000A4E84DD|nr:MULTISPECIES: glycoside hydrolase family 43 protein [unclassified Phenylobacterium]